MSKIGFQIYSLCCKVNQYDGAVLRRQLEQRGFVISSYPKLVIVNTCMVTHNAIIKDQRLIRHLIKKFPKSRIVIMGCWSEIDQGIRKIFSDQEVLWWGVGKIKQLVQRIVRLYSLELDQKIIPQSNLIAPTDRSRYFVKISDGCNQFCSYCIIPFTRGRLKSRSSQEIIKEITLATQDGYREIVLSGIHLGRYGEDLKDGKINLVNLLKEILKIENLGRIRLSSIEVNEVTPQLIKLIKQNKKICPHLHISLQSGSNKILKLMNRPYTTTYFTKKVDSLRRALPEVALTTDIIVGFPGETEVNFQDTYKFAQKIQFSKIHVFSFSAHQKTKAFNFPHKVSQLEIKRRSQILRRLSEDLEKKYQQKILNKYQNKKLSLVVEGKKNEKYRCKTEFYFDLQLSKIDLTKNILI